LARKRDRQPITLLIVPPRPERAPVSLRFPTWVLPLLLLLVLGFFLSLGYFVDSRANLERELAHYRTIVDLESSRQREMRDTILAQQEEAKALAAQVTQFQQVLAEVNQVADQVEQMMGLTTPTPTPTPTPAVSLGDDESLAVGGQLLLSADAPPAPTEMSRTTSSRGTRPTMGLVDENAAQIATMEAVIPLQIAHLNELIAEANKRLERIDPEKRTSKEQLERELKLLAAAPHLWPLDGEINITSEFGYRVLEGMREFHEGIDMGVWYGTPVKATKDGTVTFAGWNSGYGWTVEIRHEEGFATAYSHNSRLLVKKGAEVKAGDTIALSGSTGRSTGPHVHYEILLDGKPVDPMKYLGLDAGE
jgi:murein DD-endopeptidase MepM/ murein hydrolase activator NlpD